MAPVYVHNLLRGMEQSFLDPLAEPELTHELLRRVCDFEYERHRRTFEAAPGLIDIAEVTDDLGCQTGPLFSLKLYREFYKPHHQRFIKLCREFGIRVFHHDDGGMRPVPAGPGGDGHRHSQSRPMDLSRHGTDGVEA